MKNVRAKLIELYNRVVKVNVKDDSIYHNGENNLYPNEIERVINNSPTASRAAKIMTKFVLGAGVPPEMDVMINSKTKAKLSSVAAAGASDISYQYGVFFWRSFGIDDQGEIKPNRIEVLEYCKCRTSKEDDEENEGKVFYKDYEAKKNVGGKKDEKQWFWPFSDDKHVILTQIKADAKNSNATTIDEMIKNYRGQVYYLNLTPRYKYALSPVDSVFNEADTEFRMSVYDNTQSRLGFVGKTAVITQGLDDEASAQVEKDVKNWLGAENASNMLYLDVEQADDLDQVIKVLQLKPQFDDKLFENKKNHARKAILGAFNNIPEPLFMAGDTLFGTSGDTYREMKLFYSEQTEHERLALQECLKLLGFPCELKPLVEPQTTVE